MTPIQVALPIFTQVSVIDLLWPDLADAVNAAVRPPLIHTLRSYAAAL